MAFEILLFHKDRLFKADLTVSYFQILNEINSQLNKGISAL